MNETWIWLIIGLVLCAAELLTGNFVIIFFGLGALLTAAAAFLGVTHTAVLVAIFALSSLLMLMLFRRKILVKPSEQEKRKSLSPDVDVTFSLSDSIPAHDERLVAYQGTHWTAVNSSDEELAKGTTVRIERTEGIKIFVRKI